MTLVIAVAFVIMSLRIIKNSYHISSDGLHRALFDFHPPQSFLISYLVNPEDPYLRN